jgi:hypothetical protein
VIGWKDTREARRAVRDSLPLLREASNVAIIEIAEPQEQDQSQLRIEDVARYLTRHQVKLAKPPTPHAIGSVAGELLRVAREQKADLIVAGAYGHNRLAFWRRHGRTLPRLPGPLSALTLTKFPPVFSTKYDVARNDSAHRFAGLGVRSLRTLPVSRTPPT